MNDLERQQRRQRIESDPMLRATFDAITARMRELLEMPNSADADVLSAAAALAIDLQTSEAMRLLREFGTEPPMPGDEMPDDADE